jgi:hypothetical protein
MSETIIIQRIENEIIEQASGNYDEAWSVDFILSGLTDGQPWEMLSQWLGEQSWGSYPIVLLFSLIYDQPEIIGRLKGRHDQLKEERSRGA